MGGRSEPTIPAVLATWLVIVLAAAASRLWRAIAACLVWVGIVQLVRQFIYWFSH